jgi:ketosteroid isomerase-like protein
LTVAVDRFTGLGVRAGRVGSFGAVLEGSEFAARVYAAINARDRGAIKALTAPDIVVGTTVEAYRGPEALLQWLDEGDDAFDDFTVELLEVEELAGHVVASMRQRGRGKASGAEVDHRFTHVWTLRDGRAIRLQSFAHRDDAVRYAQRSGGA